MQKRQGNGVQGKQAVRPHKSSWLETEPGPGQGGHVAPRWPKHGAASRHNTALLRWATACTPDLGKHICDNYSVMSLRSGSRLRPQSIFWPGAGHRLGLSSASCSHFCSVQTKLWRQRLKLEVRNLNESKQTPDGEEGEARSQLNHIFEK